MLNGLEEHLNAFKEEWEAASTVSENLKWAIFPVGDKEIEFQTATYLMKLFDNLDAFVYFNDNNTPEQIVSILEKVLGEYKETVKDKLALASEQHDYELHLGS